MYKNAATHVIVGRHEYDYNIPHREQRLANYLVHKQETEKVYWVYPDTVSKLCENVKDNGIREVKVPTQYLSFTVPEPLLDVFPFNHQVKNMICSKFGPFKSTKSILWYYSPHLTSLSQINGLWDKIIYDCSDDHTTIGWEQKEELSKTEYTRKSIGAKLKTRSENQLLERTDLNFVSSEHLHNKIGKKYSTTTYLEETGVDFDKFEKDGSSPILDKIGEPRLGFIGKLKKKVDMDLLNGVAKKNKSWNIILVGPKRNENVEYIFNNPNVYWFEPVNPEEVPLLMNSLDIGLMPYKDIKYNKSVFPLKFNEYLASGLPVVGCGLPSTRKYVQKGVYQHTNNSIRDFSKACSEVLSWEEGVKDRKEIAKHADWNSKFDRIYHRVTGCNY
ncbi:glycosyltransferase [Natronosalvus amylolyticus]|uniref:glycosyltransferase n=1 Tax=Natronosalvus amylolyticus TaxID=2961994 RepID=UPI0020C9F6D5|nr:glycosyltransferase [Natronosalvus amylolyticus]